MKTETTSAPDSPAYATVNKSDTVRLVRFVPLSPTQSNLVQPNPAVRPGPAHGFIPGSFYGEKKVIFMADQNPSKMPEI